MERQITTRPQGHILTNINVWSPDSQWIVYDTRSDAEGATFDGQRIEMVNVETGEVRCLYESQNGACCGVATFRPQQERVAFILGPEHPTSDWSYGPAQRQGIMVDVAQPNVTVNLDARDLTPPFTLGALRGGSHVHVFSPDGAWVSFTYNDHLLAQLAGDSDARNIGVSVPAGSVRVPKTHPRNHDGAYFSVLVTQTVNHPQPGSDEIGRACEEGWVGTNGYLRADGTRQKRALAFQGEVVTIEGATISEVFIVDIPDDVTIPSSVEPLQGTSTQRPVPPSGTQQRRLTYTAQRRYPGLQGPRHWLCTAPDGSQLAFLMRDDSGVVQFWTVTPIGSEPRQVTRDNWGVASAFSWSPDGDHIAYIADKGVFVVEVATGRSRRLTPCSDDAAALLPLACVFSPDGKKIAYLRRMTNNSGQTFNQIFVVKFAY